MGWLVKIVEHLTAEETKSGANGSEHWANINKLARKLMLMLLSVCWMCKNNNCQLTRLLYPLLKRFFCRCIRLFKLTETWNKYKNKCCSKSVDIVACCITKTNIKPCMKEQRTNYHLQGRCIQTLSQRILVELVTKIV